MRRTISIDGNLLQPWLRARTLRTVSVGGEKRSYRFSLLSQGPEELELLFIDEEEYAPAFTRQLHFSVSGNCLSEDDVDFCIAAQALAFCRSYLRKVAGAAGA